jgi:DNA-directed RNA polymerase specialized sigma24 family protein
MKEEAHVDEEADHLKRFAGKDEVNARQALDWLFTNDRDCVARALGSAVRNTQGMNANDLEDIISETFTRIWIARDRYRYEGVPAWHKYLTTTAKYIFIDKVRARKSNISLDMNHIPPKDLDILIAFLEALFHKDMDDWVGQGEGKWMYHQANLLWLGLDAALPPHTHTRQLVAAQLYYLEGVPEAELAEFLPPSQPDEPPLTKQTLAKWLRDPGVLRYLTYNALYYSNDRLAGHLLGLPEPVCVAALNAQEQAARAVKGETIDRANGETAVILWRYRHGESAEDILARAECPLDRKELSALLAGLEGRLPFNKQMADVLAGIGRVRGRMEAEEILRKPGLWQRLALQYRYAEDLSLRDVHARIQSAAQQVGYKITENMLEAWLSGRRLVKRLAHFCAQGP